MTVHLYIRCWWPKGTWPSIKWWLWSICHIIHTCHHFFLCLWLKSVLKRQWFTSTEEVTSKTTRALKEASKYGFQECFQKLYGRWQKCYYQRELRWGNIVYITYFCVINRFWELFEASSIKSWVLLRLL
jgi:hypothetical protein